MWVQRLLWAVWKSCSKENEVTSLHSGACHKCCFCFFYTNYCIFFLKSLTIAFSVHGNQQICSFLCHTAQLSCTWTYTHFLRFLSINEKLHFCILLSTALISTVLVSRCVSYCKWYLVLPKHINDKGCHVLCGRKVGKPGKLVCKHSASQNNQVSRNLCTYAIDVAEFTGVKKFYLRHFRKSRHGVSTWDMVHPIWLWATQEHEKERSFYICNN